MGDGTTYNQAEVSHLYSAPGKYEVCLTVTGLNGEVSCSETVCETITVEKGCKSMPCEVAAKFELERFSSIGLSKQFNFLPSSNFNNNVTNYYWNFGDGNTSRQKNPNHTYDKPGSYKVCLYVFGNNGREGCCDQVCQEVVAKSDVSNTYINDRKKIDKIQKLR